MMRKLIWVAGLAGLAALALAGGIALAETGFASDKNQAQPRSVSAELLVGRWGDNGDCRADAMFMPDGRFNSYTGGDGHWSLQGDRLTMVGDGGVFVLGLRVIDANHIQTTSADGSINMSNRCG